MVLAVFGGVGAVLYVLGWLLIPKIGERAGLAEQWLHRPHRFSPVAVLVIVLIVAILFGGFDDGNAVAALAVLGAVAFLVHRDRTGRPLVPSYAGPQVPPTETAPGRGRGSGSGRRGVDRRSAGRRLAEADPYTWTESSHPSRAGRAPDSARSR